MLLVRRGAQCKLEAGAIVEELKNNYEEERSSGTTGTGVSQKDLQISKKQKMKRENAKKLVGKRACALQACSGGNEELGGN